MADKKLNSVSAVSDMNYVYAETSDGTTVKISKADLASVVAGVIDGTISSTHINLFETVSDLNTFFINMNLTPGAYFLRTSTASNAPDSSYALLLHMQRAAGVSTSQKICQLYSSSVGIYLRKGHGDDTTIVWSDWKQLV